MAAFDKVKEERREAEKLPMEFIRNKQLRPEKTAAESGTAVRNFAVAATRNIGPAEISPFRQGEKKWLKMDGRFGLAELSLSRFIINN